MCLIVLIRGCDCTTQATHAAALMRQAEALGSRLTDSETHVADVTTRCETQLIALRQEHAAQFLAWQGLLNEQTRRADSAEEGQRHMQSDLATALKQREVDVSTLQELLRGQVARADIAEAAVSQLQHEVDEQRSAHACSMQAAETVHAANVSAAIATAMQQYVCPRGVLLCV